MQNEIWQVHIDGQNYEITFAELTNWIADNAITETDLVRRGNLRWIQAGRVPSLHKHFAGNAFPVGATFAPRAATPQIVDFQREKNQFQPNLLQTENNCAANEFDSMPESDRNSAQPNSSVCHFHTELASTYVCKNCVKRFCRDCPKAFGTIRLCPLCGEMCEHYETYQREFERTSRVAESQSGFGFADFGESFAYPFKFKTSLLFGALFYSILLMGGFFGSLLANMLLFGCVAQTIGQIAHGNKNRNFMPDFDDFNFWDDVLHPWFLGIGVFLVAWLPAIVLFIVLIFNAAGTISQLESESKPGAMEASPSAIILRDEERGTLSQEDFDALIDHKNPEKVAAALRRVEELKKQTETEKARGAKLQSETVSAMIKNLFRAALPIVLLLLVGVLWGMFYSPVALAIAGYTRSFLSVMNPMVGIDTIKRMGFATYFKAFLMYLAVCVLSGIVGSIVSAVTAPFDLPLVGNLPATFIGGVFYFYTLLVIACILGLALYKSADKLGIEVE